MGLQVEMELTRVVIYENRDQQIIHLVERGGTRGFPIVIGINEAAEIHRKLTGQKPMRPMTHDLICALLTGTGCKFEKIVVSDLRENTFYATIHLSREGGESIQLDSRPSDAICLAVAHKSKIYVAEEVLERLGQGS